LRILHVSTRLILGGSQENTVLSCEGQARLGHEVHLAFGPIYGPEGSLLERVQRFRSADGREITTHVVPHLIRQIHPWADARCFGELKSLIRRIRPDIVHTHSSKAGILGRAAAWSVRASTKRADFDQSLDALRAMGIVHTIHGPPFHKFQRKAVNTLYVASERWAARRCDVIVSVADAMTTQYRAEGIGSEGQYTTVRSGMEVESFLRVSNDESRRASRAALGLAANDFVVGTVARLAELKGHDDLLDALAPELKARLDWKLLWVGDGWWRDRLTARIREMRLENKVVMTRLVSPERVPEMISAMDVLAHPSSREGLPRTVPQALLCGVVPVAYDVDGTGEVCRDGETGRLIGAGDLGSLRSAVVGLYDDAEERRRLAQRGQAECREMFSAERMVSRLEDVYEHAREQAARG